MDAWQVYMEEFRRRGERAAGQEIGRTELLSEAAHDAYRSAADRMTGQHGWGDEHTLVVMRGLNGAVKEWLGQGGADWEALAAEMRRRETELREGLQAGGSGGGLPNAENSRPGGSRVRDGERP